MEILGTLAVIFLLAFLVEALIEAVLGVPFDYIQAIAQYKKPVLTYSAFAVGVAGAFIYTFDIVAELSVFLGAPVAVTQFGIILTGLAIGRGSHFIHEIFKRFVASPPLDPTSDYVEIARYVNDPDFENAVDPRVVG